MKKSIYLFVLAGGIFTLFSFMLFSNAEKTTAENEFNLNDHMHKVVYKELAVLTGYNPQKSYSRCPSGFSFHKDDVKSNDAIAYGTIFSAQGCTRDEFCHFKVMVEGRKTFLKKETNDQFLAMDDFVKEEQSKMKKETPTAKY